MLDLEKLHQFVVLARHGSYTTAATLLHVSQPTLTRNIQSLEKTLKVRLLDRGRNGIALTATGSDLLRHAHSILQHADSITADLSERSEGIRGHVRIGAGPMVGGSMLPGVISDVLDSGRDITIRTVLSQTQTMYTLLLDGELDFFVSRMPSPPWADDLETTVLGVARPSFYVRHDHPLTRPEEVTFEDISQYPRVGVTAWNEMLSEAVDASIARLISATIESDDIAVLNHLAHQGLAVLIGSVQPLHDGLVKLDVGDYSDVLPGSQVTLNQPANRTLSPAVNYVLELTSRRARAMFGE